MRKLSILLSLFSLIACSNYTDVDIESDTMPTIRYEDTTRSFDLVFPEDSRVSWCTPFSRDQHEYYVVADSSFIIYEIQNIVKAVYSNVELFILKNDDQPENFVQIGVFVDGTDVFTWYDFYLVKDCSSEPANKYIMY